jgi:repressor LexA
MTQRHHIKPGTRLTFSLSSRERDVIVERAFLDPEIETRLRAAAVSGSRVVLELTLDDVDDLHGCVAAEANHCDNAKARRALDAVCDRLAALEDRYTDELPAQAVAKAERATFTAKQGQYLAFIYYFTRIYGRPPAEADLQQFFQVSPPAVHAMILTLERRGLINRTPGKARSVTLRVSRAQLPDSE